MRLPLVCLGTLALLATTCVDSKPLSLFGGIGHKKSHRGLRKKSHNAPIHIVFSTGCNEFQHWQSEVLLSSAIHVGQNTKITQMIVGCDEREDKDMGGKERHLTHPAGAADNVVTNDMWSKSVHPNVERIFVPSIKEAREFPWYNKPWSYKFYVDWLKKHGGAGDEVFAIIDPDEFFLKQLTNEGTRRDGLVCNMQQKFIDSLLDRHPHPAGEALDVVRPGKAVAQTYGLGPGIVSKFDRAKICGEGALCTKIDTEEASQYHSTGPPYMMHAQDFMKVMPQWFEFMGPVYKQDKGDIQADMYAYGLAAENNGLRHMQLDQYMVSAVSTPVYLGACTWIYWILDIESSHIGVR
jgi:hypothetical protein